MPPVIVKASGSPGRIIISSKSVTLTTLLIVLMVQTVVFFLMFRDIPAWKSIQEEQTPLMHLVEQVHNTQLWAAFAPPTMQHQQFKMRTTMVIRLPI